MTASTIPNTEMLDNLATGLQMIVMRRLAKLVDLITQSCDQGNLEAEAAVRWALEEFDGLEAEIRRQLDDREWAGVRVGPEQAVR